MTNKSNKFSFKPQITGKGLTVVSTCLEGGFTAQAYCEKESAKRTIRKQMNDEKVKGFCSVLVTKKVSEGCSSLIQTAGLGGLRHNTVIVGWPREWKTNPTKVTQFMSIVKTVTLNRNALLIPRGIDNWPEIGKFIFFFFYLIYISCTMGTMFPEHIDLLIA